MSNMLKNETSPYLLQHSENPVNWFVGRGAVADGHYPVKLRAGAHHRLLGEVVVAV